MSKEMKEILKGGYSDGASQAGKASAEIRIEHPSTQIFDLLRPISTSTGEDEASYEDNVSLRGCFRGGLWVYYLDAKWRDSLEKWGLVRRTMVEEHNANFLCRPILCMHWATCTPRVNWPATMKSSCLLTTPWRQGCPLSCWDHE
jgi:hypothetical protein